MAPPGQMNCTNCGAALPASVASARACRFCGTAVRMPASVRRPSEFDETRARKSAGAGGVIAAVVAIALAGVAVAFGIVLNRAGSRHVSVPIERAETAASALADESPPGPRNEPERTAPEPPEPARPLRRVLDFGGKGDGPGLFQDPRELAVDGEGFIYVADYMTGRIQKFDPQGKYVALIHVDPTPVGLNFIWGMVAIGRELFVVRSGELLRLSTDDGKKLGSLPLVAPKSSYHHVAADQAGNLYAMSTNSDDEHGDILKFDKAGKVLGRWPRHILGHEEIQLSDDRIAVTGPGAMFILHSKGLFVEALDEKGTLLNRIGEKGDGPGTFNHLFMATIAVDGRGHVLVHGNRWDFDVFDTGGRFRGELGFERERVNIRSFVVGEGGRLYITAHPEHVYVYEIDPQAVDKLSP